MMQKKKKLILVLFFILCMGMTSGTVSAAGKTGWLKKSNQWFYYENGVQKKGWLKTADGNWYYLRPADGRMVTGFQNIGKYMYYFDSTGARVKEKWVKFRSYWYYFGSNGAGAKNCWKKISGSWYYFESNCRMAKGIKKIGGKIYYLFPVGRNINGVFWPEGAMYSNGWIKTGGQWLYFSADGSMRTGWQKIGGVWYYLGKNGVMVTGWQIIDGEEYYFQSSGAMVSGCTMKIDGKTYRFKGSGALDKSEFTDRDHIDARTLTKATLDSMNLSGVDKLMIVAHPDDESLWGGAHLMNGNYLVVCLTNAYTSHYGYTRATEFFNACKKSGDKSIIMYYPDYDYNKGQKDNWNGVRASIMKDIQTLLTYKKWSQVVTHNPEGEYGHIHHKMTNQIVTSLAKKDGLYTNLIYFGRYYSKKFLESMTVKPARLSGGNTYRKQQMTNIYYNGSQKGAVEASTHMIPYENWVRASAWK